MSDLIRIAVDAMGGDNAPASIVEGAVMAVNESKEIMVYLTGDQEAVRKELDKYTYDADRLQIVHASEVITNEEHPAMAIHDKPDSSIAVGERMVRDGKADAFISGGSTGAVLVGGQLIVGRIRGVRRPALASIIPTDKGFSLLIDCGANVDAKPEQLLQYAQMGTIYLSNIMHIQNPEVRILNIGAEEEKGNALVQETFPLLKACSDINFKGSIEARDVSYGAADIIVCDAFAGNIVLKMYEGAASMLFKNIKAALLSTFRSKIGALLIKKSLKEKLKQFDITKYGGAPMLGLRGLVAKVHGNASSKEVKHAILQCIDYKKNDIQGKVAMAIRQEGSAD